MLVRRPSFKLKVNQEVAVQNPQKTSVGAKKSLKDIFVGHLVYIPFFSLIGCRVQMHLGILTDKTMCLVIIQNPNIVSPSKTIELK